MFRNIIYLFNSRVHFRPESVCGCVKIPDMPGYSCNIERAAGFRYQFVTLVPSEDGQKYQMTFKLYPQVEYVRENSTNDGVAEERSNDKWNSTCNTENGDCHLANSTSNCDRLSAVSTTIVQYEIIADGFFQFDKGRHFGRDISASSGSLRLHCVPWTVRTLLNQSDKIINNDFGIEGKAIDESKFDVQFSRVVWHALTVSAWALVGRWPNRLLFVYKHYADKIIWNNFAMNRSVISVLLFRFVGRLRQCQHIFMLTMYNAKINM